MITTIKEFKKINENNENKVELIFHLDSPYKWGKGWTASPEAHDRLKMEAMSICNNLHFNSDIGKYGVVEGEPKDPNSNMYNAYMHPMEFVFKLKEYNQTDIELIKANVEDGISNLNEHFPISIKEIKLNNKGEYSTITESYKLGAKYSSDFDYEGMLKMGANIKIEDGIQKLQKLFDSFEDVNYHTESKPLYKAIQYLKSNNVEAAKLNLEIFNEICKEELGISINENVDTKIPALPVDVYRNKRGGATNGITAQKDDLMLVFDGLNSPFNVDALEDDDYLVLQTKSFRGKEYKYAVPKSILDSGKHSMFGGNFVYSSDARFPSDAPIKVHDRVE